MPPHFAVLVCHAWVVSAATCCSLWTVVQAGAYQQPLLCCLPQVGLWYGREVALYLFAQEAAVADQVAVFCRWGGGQPRVPVTLLLVFLFNNHCLQATVVASVAGGGRPGGRVLRVCMGGWGGVGG